MVIIIIDFIKLCHLKHGICNGHDTINFKGNEIEYFDYLESRGVEIQILFCITNRILKSMHSWDTTFGTKDLRTLLHWIPAFIMIYYYLINKF
jgi:hypothetical protein